MRRRNPRRFFSQKLNDKTFSSRKPSEHSHELTTLNNISSIIKSHQIEFFSSQSQKKIENADTVLSCLESLEKDLLSNLQNNIKEKRYYNERVKILLLIFIGSNSDRQNQKKEKGL